MTCLRYMSFRTARLGPLHALLGAGLLLIAGPGHTAPPGTEVPATPANAPTPEALTPEALDAAVARFNAAVDAWDLDAAAAEVAAMPAGSVRDVKAGVLALFRAEYPAAEALLSGALTAGQLPAASAISHEAQHYLGLARGEQRALGPATRQRSPDGHVEVVFADARDALLAPYLFAAMADARAALGDEIGVLPQHPVRFEILDDPAKLAMVSPLTLDNVYTTGTVGITKYRRIIMISPRVLLQGYGWLDTAVHEYVHYLVTLRTRNHAPVWLQEGLAKLLETRWRSPTPLPLEPVPRKLLARGIARDDLVSFAEMYPSLAMLPSQERAALAYAQVQTMLELLREARGRPGLGLLLDQVAAGAAAEDALASAWGGSFEAFYEHWKTTLRSRTAGKTGPASLRKLQFVDPAKAAEDEPADPSLLGDIFSHLGGGKARQHARLGVLLTLRGQLGPAARQYEKARAAEPRVAADPKLARRLGELYLQLGRAQRAVPLLRLAGLDDPEQANVAAAEGRALLQTGDRPAARAALLRALRVNPFIPTLHCDLARLAEADDERRREQALCRE
jgi:tetratricopeptide (TPR) repeat protein